MIRIRVAPAKGHKDKHRVERGQRMETTSSFLRRATHELRRATHELRGV